MVVLRRPPPAEALVCPRHQAPVASRHLLESLVVVAPSVAFHPLAPMDALVHHLLGAAAFHLKALPEAVAECRRPLAWAAACPHHLVLAEVSPD